MARRGQKDLFSRLADVGEEAIQKMGEIPGANRLLETVAGTRERLDELTKKVRGIDALERRVAALERRVDKLGPAGTGSASRRTAGTAARGASGTRRKAAQAGAARKTGESPRRSSPGSSGRTGSQGPG
jgi:hypothetical protein